MRTMVRHFCRVLRSSCFRLYVFWVVDIDIDLQTVCEVGLSSEAAV